MPRVTAEHVRVPDLRFDLSAYRTRKLGSSLLTIAVTGPAAALVAVAVGIAGPAQVSAEAQPASVAGTAHPAGSPSQSTAEPGAGVGAALDSSAKPLGGRTRAVPRRRRVRLTPHLIARRMLHRFGWSQRQFKFLDWLWNRESSWNVHASNPYSGAYGIPQAVPGSKMASAGPHWWSSAFTQIRWGLRYIKGRYGSPRGAWDHEVATGWY